MESTDIGGDLVFTITYNTRPGGGTAAKDIRGMPGIKDEKCFGSNVTVSATGLQEDGHRAWTFDLSHLTFIVQIRGWGWCSSWWAGKQASRRTYATA